MNPEHVIQPGETWEDIAALYGISVEMLLIFNQIRTSDQLYIEVEQGNGRYQTLRIPDPEVEWCIDDSTPTPELVPCDRPNTLEEQMLVEEQAGLLQIEIDQDTRNWPEWSTIRELPIVENIVEYDPAGFYLVQDPQTGITTAYSVWRVQNPGIFDSGQLTRDFLYQWLGDEDAAENFDTLEDSAEYWLLQQLALWVGATSYFQTRENPPDTPEIIARLEELLGEGYTYEDVAQLVLTVTETLQQDPGLHSASFATLEQLRHQAGLYEMAAQLDAVRQALHQWQPQQELQLLAQLATNTALIPEEVLGISNREVLTGFNNFHTVMQQRYDMLFGLQFDVLEAEAYFAQLREITNANLNFSSTTFTFLVEAMLSIFVEPIDWILTARDILQGNVVALLGLLPFIPGSIDRLGRLASSIPELMGDAQRLLGDVWDDIASETGDLLRWLVGDTDLRPAFAGEGSSDNMYLLFNSSAPPKRANLPSYRTIEIDMPHIESNHTVGGQGVLAGAQNKSLWPSDWTLQQIESATRRAYRVAQRIGYRGESILVRGVLENGMTIEMYVNPTTHIIETAYPIGY